MVHKQQAVIAALWWPALFAWFLAWPGLASDGLWDVIGHQEAADMAVHSLQVRLLSLQLSNATPLCRCLLGRSCPVCGCVPLCQQQGWGVLVVACSCVARCLCCCLSLSSLPTILTTLNELLLLRCRAAAAAGS
jgi:hypothetical protein